MTQRNVELQLQALDLIERRHLTSQKSEEAEGAASAVEAAPDTLDELTQEEME